jgi:aryl-alcohol dehydrogenase-like predicted oxidoreductase
VERLLPLAAEVGATLSQYALAWIVGNDAVTAPILGPRTSDQLEDNLRALDLTIPAEHRSRIDALVPPGMRIGSTLG